MDSMQVRSSRKSSGDCKERSDDEVMQVGAPEASLIFFQSFVSELLLIV